MPPKKRARPDSALEGPALTALKKELEAANLAAQVENGRVLVRRLTRTEYEYTLQDLLGIPGAIWRSTYRLKMIQSVLTRFRPNRASHRCMCSAIWQWRTSRSMKRSNWGGAAAMDATTAGRLPE
ncbi:MAG: hypothetical protein M2R45_05120 [Verrucomicrobia subdivision 3 bacterium]|nr:hypothetical protein [Limisphaerales bacterium]MCS1417182.1 hypothetical protein [Limisphaerales bacterium]